MSLATVGPILIGTDAPWLLKASHCNVRIMLNIRKDREISNGTTAQTSLKDHVELVSSIVLLSMGVGLSTAMTIELILKWMGL